MIAFFLLQSHLWIFLFSDSFSVPGCYLTNEAYILHELVKGDHSPPFCSLLVGLGSQNSEYYIANKKQIIKAIKKNVLEFDNLQMIIQPTCQIYALNNNNEFQCIFPINYSFNPISEILQLADTEIYKIGEKYYVLRRIKYAYIDSIKLKYEDRWDGTLVNYEREYSGLFLFTIELLQTHSKIKKYLWKRKWELPIFWHENVHRIVHKKMDYDFLE